VGGGEGSKCFLAMCKGVELQMNDLVDVLVGTGKGVTGNKAFPTKARFKGVRVEKGVERFLCRPIVGSQKGRCPSFPPESCLKVKAFGSDVYGETKPRFFSKLSTEVQERLPQPTPASPPTPYTTLSPLSHAPPPPPFPIYTPQPHSRLMFQANREGMERQKKAVNALNLARARAAEHKRERYYFLNYWAVRSPAQIYFNVLNLCLPVPVIQLRLLQECGTNVNNKRQQS